MPIHISLSVVTLLQELIDSNEEATIVLIDALIANHGYEALVHNMSRLDITQSEDAAGEHNTLEILEESIASHAPVADLLVEKTQILTFLLNRIQSHAIDTNRLYCTEILSILAQASEYNRIAIGKVDGIEILLRALAVCCRCCCDLPTGTG
jgi:beta-catenin-like protein 1